MPRAEEVIFPAVLVLGVEHIYVRTYNLVPLDGADVVSEQVGARPTDHRDVLELVVARERRILPNRTANTCGVMSDSSWILVEQGSDPVLCQNSALLK